MTSTTTAIPTTSSATGTTYASSSTTQKKQLKVAVIGGGPGAIFFCHALESKRRTLEEQLRNMDNAKDKEDAMDLLQAELDSLPAITCFEMANAPGGVWRSTTGGDTTTTPASSTSTATSATAKTDTNMYEALWCNGPKEVMEFFDYTFEEHFKENIIDAAENVAEQQQHQQPPMQEQVKLPVYLPRQCVLEYILARVTRHCPNFFEKYMQFETRVDKVEYRATDRTFHVMTTHLPTQQQQHQHQHQPQQFDKVIWSAGQNGTAKIPGPIRHAFEAALEDYNKTVQATTSSESSPLPPPPVFLHASAVEQTIAEQIRDRHLVLIGGSYSAEDLAFMGIKWGAKHITILARRQGIDVPVCWSSNWPDNKVTVVTGYKPKSVRINDNTNTTNNKKDGASFDITLQKYAHELDVQEVYENSSAVNGDTTNNKNSTAPPTSIRDVHVVICCTGYSENFDMLDASCYNMTPEQYKEYWNDQDRMALPQDWRMPTNPLSQILSSYWDPIKHDQALKDDADDESDRDNNKGEKMRDEKANILTDAEEKKQEDGDVDTDAADAAADAAARESNRGKPPAPPIIDSDGNIHIPPHTETLYPGNYVSPYLYREIVFTYNPNLMLLLANNFETPLLALDVQAWLALRYITGEQPLPSREEMVRDNYQQALREMTMPMSRYWMDSNYHNVVRAWLSQNTRKLHYRDQDGNPCVRYSHPPEWENAYKETCEYEMNLLARLMQDANYPLRLGDFDELNDKGRKFVEINWFCRNEKTDPQKGTTFRDVTEEHCDRIVSVFTGAKPVPFKKRWLDLDDLSNINEISGKRTTTTVAAAGTIRRPQKKYLLPLVAMAVLHHHHAAAFFATAPSFYRPVVRTRQSLPNLPFINLRFPSLPHPSLIERTHSSTDLNMALVPLSVEDLDRLLVVAGPPTGEQAATYWGRTQRERYGRVFESSVVTILGVMFSYFLSFVLGGFVATILGSIFLFWSIFSPQLQAYQRNWELRGGRDLVDPWIVSSNGYEFFDEEEKAEEDEGRRGLYGALFLGRIEDVCVVEEENATASDEYDLSDFANYKMEEDELEEWAGTPYLLRVNFQDGTGRTLQVHSRMSEEYIDLEPGQPVLGVMLSTSQSFTTLAALTDIFVPDLKIWIGDYPYLDRAETEQLLANDDEVWDLLESERLDGDALIL